MLHADGSIDPAASDVRRAQATDPAMQHGRHDPSVRPVPDAVADTLDAAKKRLFQLARDERTPGRRGRRGVEAIIAAEAGVDQARMQQLITKHPKSFPDIRY